MPRDIATIGYDAFGNEQDKQPGKAVLYTQVILSASRNNCPAINDMVVVIGHQDLLVSCMCHSPSTLLTAPPLTDCLDTAAYLLGPKWVSGGFNGFGPCWLSFFSPKYLSMFRSNIRHCGWTRHNALTINANSIVHLTLTTGITHLLTCTDDQLLDCGHSHIACKPNHPYSSLPLQFPLNRNMATQGNVPLKILDKTVTISFYMCSKN